MKIRLLSLALLVCFSVPALAGKKKGKKKKTEETQTQTMELKNDLDSLSYALGVSIANNLKNQGVESMNSGAFAAAIDAVYAGTDTNMTMDDANQYINSYFASAAEKKSKAQKEIGEKFLAENSKKEDVVVLPSGLQYKVLKMGDGPKPGAEDKVTTHYHGTLIDGTVFDSSVERGQPATFPVGGVIKGWVEALQLMPVGSKWVLYVPSDLAYGDRGAGPKIGPHTTLVFEVELLKIEE